LLTVTRTPHLLQIRNLSRATFGPVTLDIAGGDCLCIYGPSGAGKSQLLRAIADLDPHDGDLLLDGVPACEMTPAGWRTRVGLLPPDSNWWFNTPGEHFNNGMPVPLEQIGLTGAVLDQPVARLSSGEKQRLALLRLLANKPRVLLLDEPTANLDPENTRRIEAVIADYRKVNDAAVLWVSHDRQQVARVANRSLEFGHGDIQEHTVAARQ
jgi:ABC-type iron transport system FetAB ATPase subunit